MQRARAYSAGWVFVLALERASRSSERIVVLALAEIWQSTLEALALAAGECRAPGNASECRRFLRSRKSGDRASPSKLRFTLRSSRLWVADAPRVIVGSHSRSASPMVHPTFLAAQWRTFVPTHSTGPVECGRRRQLHATGQTGEQLHSAGVRRDAAAALPVRCRTPTRAAISTRAVGCRH